VIVRIGNHGEVISPWTGARHAVCGLVDLLFPLRCAGCGKAGVGLCAQCARLLTALRRLRRPLLATGPPAYALGHYRGAARQAVLAYKEAGRRDLAEPFAQRFATGLRAIVGGGYVPQPKWVVPAPSRSVASRRRGGPHMLRVARHVGAILSTAGWELAVADCLALLPGVRDSAGLLPAERVRNLAGRLRVRRRWLPPNDAPVVVIDDIVTTGATAASCAGELAGAGVRVVAVLGLTATAG
jgi:predicted amidophosphoribosyltransferase